MDRRACVASSNSGDLTKNALPSPGYRGPARFPTALVILPLTPTTPPPSSTMSSGGTSIQFTPPAPPPPATTRFVSAATTSPLQTAVTHRPAQQHLDTRFLNTVMMERPLEAHELQCAGHHAAVQMSSRPGEFLGCVGPIHLPSAPISLSSENDNFQAIRREHYHHPVQHHVKMEPTFDFRHDMDSITQSDITLQHRENINEAQHHGMTPPLSGGRCDDEEPEEDPPSDTGDDLIAPINMTQSNMASTSSSQAYVTSSAPPPPNHVQNSIADNDCGDGNHSLKDNDTLAAAPSMIVMGRNKSEIISSRTILGQ